MTLLTGLGKLKNFNNVKRAASVAKWKIIGAGVNGVAYNKGNKVIKIAKSNTTSEYNIMKNLRNSGYVPKVYNFQKGDGFTAYSMNKLNNPQNFLKYYINQKNNGVKRQLLGNLESIVKNLHRRGISHGNLHAGAQSGGNILVTIDPKTGKAKVWLIDFGKSIRIPTGKTESSVYKGLNKKTEKGYGTSYGPLNSRPNNIRLRTFTQMGKYLK